MHICVHMQVCARFYEKGKGSQLSLACFVCLSEDNICVSKGTHTHTHIYISQHCCQRFYVVFQIVFRNRFEILVYFLSSATFSFFNFFFKPIYFPQWYDSSFVVIRLLQCSPRLFSLSSLDSLSLPIYISLYLLVCILNACIASLNKRSCDPQEWNVGVDSLNMPLFPFLNTLYLTLSLTHARIHTMHCLDPFAFSLLFLISTLLTPSSCFLFLP